MKNKLLTEQQAWTKIGRAWESKKLSMDEEGQTYLTHFDCRNYGICRCIARLSNGCSIDYSVKLEMEWKMRELAPPPICSPGYGYRWPLTRAGAKQRAAFCFRMARLCAKENKVRKGKRK